MKFIAACIVGLIPAVTCVAIAGALALHDSAGWGWFLFAALILYPRVRTD